MTLDAICNIVQIAGGTLFGISQSGDPSEGDSNINPELGQNVLKAGLALQVASWIIFIAFLGVAIWRANRTSRNRHLAERRYDPLRWYLWVVLVACVLIFWRACFRLAESVTGESSEMGKEAVTDDGQASSVVPLHEKIISVVSNFFRSSCALLSSLPCRLTDSSNIPGLGLPQRARKGWDQEAMRLEHLDRWLFSRWSGLDLQITGTHTSPDSETFQLGCCMDDDCMHMLGKRLRFPTNPAPSTL